MMKRFLLFFILLINVSVFAQKPLTGDAYYKLILEGRMAWFEEDCHFYPSYENINIMYNVVMDRARITTDGHYFKEEIDRYRNQEDVINIELTTSNRPFWDFGENGRTCLKDPFPITSYIFSVPTCSSKSFIHPVFDVDYVHIKSYPVIKLNLPSPSEQYIIPSDKNLVVNLPPNLRDADYNWKYSIMKQGKKEEKDIPAPYNNKASLNIPVSKIVKKEDYGKVISLWIAPECGASSESGVFRFIVLLAGPKILPSSKVNSPKCIDGLGSVELKFDRKLYKGEKRVEFFVNSKGIDSVRNAKLVKQLRRGRTVILDSLEPGPHEIRITGVYNENPTYSDGEQVRVFKIKAADTLRFDKNKSTDIYCYDGNDGKIEIQAEGGEPGYQYSLNNGEWVDFSTEKKTAIENLIAGNYRVRVRDKNKCIAKEKGEDKVMNVTLTQPESPLDISEWDISEPTGFGLNNGSISVNIKGGTHKADGSYFYEWRKDNSTETVNTVETSTLGGGFGMLLKNIGAGKYYLTIKDDNYKSATSKGNCGIISREFIVNQPDPLTISAFTKEDVSCNSANKYPHKADKNRNRIPDEAEDGKIVITVTGGVTPYRYEWKKKNKSGTFNLLEEETNSLLKNITPGQYKVTVTDKNGNTTSEVYTVASPAELRDGISGRNIFCHGSHTGIARVSPSGGKGNYSYKWSNDLTTQQIENLAAGEYNVIVTDKNQCRVAGKITLTQPKEDFRIKKETVKTPTGYGLSNGSIVITVGGGTSGSNGSYSYEWRKVSYKGTLLSNTTAKTSKGNYVISLNNIKAGRYFLTVKDKNYTSSDPQDCLIIQKEFVITEPDLLTISAFTKKDVSCNSANKYPHKADKNKNRIPDETEDGKIAITVTGGVTPYRYEWKKKNKSGVFGLLKGKTNSLLKNITSGQYKVTVTDKNGNTTSEVYTVASPAELRHGISGRNIFCHGSHTGIARVSPSGGKGNYSYKWSNDLTSQQIENLAAGEYNVVVTDKNQCRVAGKITLTQPEEDFRIKKETVKTPTGYGLSNGSIIITVGGGTSGSNGSYSYEWRKGSYKGTLLSNTTAKTSKGNYVISLNNIKAGRYFLTVKDKNYTSSDPQDCLIIKKEFVITEPDLLTISAFTKKDVSCNSANKYPHKADKDRNRIPDEAEDGKIVITVTGGVTPYRYEWKKKNKSGVFGLLKGKTNSLLKNITPGQYKVTITDKNGNTTSEVYTVASPAELRHGISGRNIFCHGSHTGIARVSPSGGKGNYSYKWSNDLTTQQIENLAAGEYNVVVTDKNQCRVAGKITLTQPKEDFRIKKETVKTPTGYGLSNGSIVITVGGGTSGSNGSYSYEWRKGSYKGTLLSNTTAKTSKGSYVISLNNIKAGRYFLTVKDKNYTSSEPQDCLIIQKEFVITEPDLLTISAFTKKDVSCNRNNKYPYKTDKNNNGIPDEAEDGRIEVAATGGVTPYRYEWKKKNKNGVFEILKKETNALLANIIPGEYQVVVRDKYNNTVSENYSIISPVGIKLSVSGVKNILCHGASTGAADVFVSGEEGASYSYRWSNGLTTPEIRNIAAGEYDIVVTNEKQCRVSEKIILTEPKEAFRIKDEMVTTATVHGGSNGKIKVVIGGGTSKADGSYSYEWRKGSYEGSLLSNVTTKISNGNYVIKLNNIKAGKYFLIVKDENYDVNNPMDCLIIRKEFEVTEPAPLELKTIIKQDISCNRNNKYPYKTDKNNNGIPDEAEDGKIEIAVTGGITPYRYEWKKKNKNGIFEILKEETNALLANITPGEYQVVVTDDKNNTISENYTITTPAEVKLSVSGVNLLCHGARTGAADVFVSGEKGASYSYRWSNGLTTPEISNIAAGEYEIVVTNENQCRISEKIILTEPKEVFGIKKEELKTPTGYGLGNGSIALEIGGGTPKADGSYSYEWRKDSYDGTLLSNVTTKISDGNYVIKLNNIKAGKYFLIVKDENYDVNNPMDCLIIRKEFEVTEPAPLELKTIIKQDISCNRNNKYPYKTDKNNNGIPDEAEDGKIEIAVTGGVIPYKYEWKKKNENGIFEILKEETNALLANIIPGEYQVVVTDAENNTISENYTITTPAKVKLSVSGINLLCHGARTGAAGVFVSGEKGASYSYRWSNGLTTPEISNIAAGEYEIVVTNENQCRISEKIILTEPKEVFGIKKEELKTPTGYGLGNGSIALEIGGGTPKADGSYSYEWRKDSYDGDLLSNTTAKISNGRYVIKLNNIKAGKYYLIVKDENYDSNNPTDCLIIRKKFEVTQPKPLKLKLYVERQISCNAANNYRNKIDYDKNGVPDEAENGILQVLVRGGVQPYTYEWQQETDGSFKTIKKGKDSILKKLTQGNYRVKITDRNGNNVEATKSLLFPPELTVSLTSRNLVCHNVNTGEISSLISGGTGSYFHYSWNEDTYNSSSIKELAAGKYTLVVTDEKNCSVLDEVELLQPATTFRILENSIQTKEPTGYGLKNGFIHLKIIGGTPEANGTYRYEWHKDTPEGKLITNAETVVTDQGFSIHLNAIGAGHYYLIVKDKNYTSANSMDCLLIVEEFIIGQPESLVAQIEESNFISCNIANKYDYKEDVDNNGIPDKAEDGILKTIVKGGVGTYRYQWQKKVKGKFHNITGATNSRLLKVTAGNYRVVVSDDNNNVTSSEYNVKYPKELKLKIFAQSPGCYGTAEGKLSAMVSGGTGHYHYQWSTLDKSSKIEGLPVGKYFLLVTDDKKCNVNGNILMTQPEQLLVSNVKVRNPSSPGANNGKIKLKIHGGLPPYVVNWSNGMTGESIKHLSQGKYIATVIDSKGCSVVKEYQLTGADKLMVDLGEDVITLCKGASQKYDVTINDTDASYKWMDKSGSIIATTPKIAISEPGVYSVEVKDSYGNTASDSVAIYLSDIELQPEFMLTTHAYMESSVMLVNSSKIKPERVEWILPENENIQIIGETEEYLELKFLKTGKYEIGLKGIEGNCEKTFYKTIVVEENLENVEIVPTAISNIKEFVIVPNPNNGRYKVLIKLNKPQSIKLRTFSMNTHEPYAPILRKKAKQFEVAFNRKLFPGVYFVILETGGEAQLKKMIVH